MKKKCFNITLACMLVTGYFFKVTAQSRRVYSTNQLSFQYGLSLKGVLEFNFSKYSRTPVLRVCANFGLGSNLLARALYFSINEELQLYNGGLGSKRRKSNNKPVFTFDLVNAFTLTAGLNNYFTADSIPVIATTNRNVPLYYFSNFCYPALQNPYDQSVSVGTNYIVSSDKSKTNQRIGFLNVHLKTIQFSYYNDGGTPFDETFLGDSRDRFYTGGAMFSYKGNSGNAINLLELTFNKFTGYTKNAFEISNALDLGYVNYNNAEQKYFNKSLWSLNISNPEKGLGININRYNYTNWDAQHLLHFSVYNSYHLVPYDDYFSVSGVYYHNYTNIGLR